jgi:Concanavalin A-like lectin/glucanases superfamily
MDRIRNFANTNRGTVINTVYIFAALVVVYYVAMFYLSKDDLDVTLLPRPRLLTGENVPLTLYEKDKSPPDRRIKPGGEYTISAWLYINSWKNAGQSILTVFEEGAGNDAIMEIGLYPNQSKMVIRAGRMYDSSDTTNYNNNNAEAEKVYTNDLTSLTGSNLRQCDLVDIDMQRWIFLTVSVNGRIMDVYMDGKLARSCILPTVQNYIGTNSQYVGISGAANKVDGQISGVRFSAYAVTPDQIYAQYQAGPYTYVGFIDYLKSKLGVTITYAGKAD